MDLNRIPKLKERELRSTTGLGRVDFNNLVLLFDEEFILRRTLHAKKFEEDTDRKHFFAGTPKFKTSEHKLFMLLFYLKTYPSYDTMGVIFDCSNKTIKENIDNHLPILLDVLENQGVLPKREFESGEEMFQFFKKHKELLVDATERFIHRKADKQEQKEYYNGKKKDIQLKIR